MIRTGLLLGTDAHSMPLASSRISRFAGNRAICGNRHDDKISHVTRSAARSSLSRENAETDERNPRWWRWMIQRLRLDLDCDVLSLVDFNVEVWGGDFSWLCEADRSEDRSRRSRSADREILGTENVRAIASLNRDTLLEKGSFPGRIEKALESALIDRSSKIKTLNPTPLRRTTCYIARWIL